MVKMASQGSVTAWINLLKGGAALFAVEKKVTRQQWYVYVDRLKLERYRGVLGMGVSSKVPPGGEEALLQRMPMTAMRPAAWMMALRS